MVLFEQQILEIDLLLNFFVFVLQL